MGRVVLQWYGAKFLAIDDHVEIWYYFLSQEVVNSVSNPPEWLVELASRWYEEATVRTAPGIVFDFLETYVTAYSRRDIVLEVARKAKSTLTSCGTTLSAEWLSENNISGNQTWVAGIEVEAVNKVAEEFIRILREGKLPLNS